MSWTLPTASPLEVQNILADSSDPTEPSCDLATLESIYSSWPYPKGLDFWEGFIYADLCFQTGWAYFHFGEKKAALKVWRECPWPATDDAERQALLEILQPAIAEQSLTLSPPVVELLNSGIFQLSDVTASLANPNCVLSHSTSGLGYTLVSSIVRPEGLYELSLEFDANTLYFARFLPIEVSAQLATARTFYQLGEPSECASWLLRAAFTSSLRGQDNQAFAFLKKAVQLAPENLSVQKSLTTLIGRGARLTLASRAISERALEALLPSKRTAVRPDEYPIPMEAESCLNVETLTTRWPLLQPTKGSADGEARSLRANDLSLPKAFEIWQKCHMSEDSAKAVLLAEGLRDCVIQNRETVTRNLSLARAVSPEKLGQWKRDLNAPISMLLEAWPSREQARPAADFVLPTEADLLLLPASECWQVLLHLQLELSGIGTGVEASAWLRRLKKEHDMVLMLLGDECFWFYLDALPEEDRVDRMLSDLLCFAPDFEETFEVAHIKPYGKGWLLPVAILTGVGKSESVDLN